MPIGPFEISTWLAPVKCEELERRSLARTIRIVFPVAIIAAPAASAHFTTPLGRGAQAITYRGAMVAQSGGDIDFESRQSKGTPFRMDLALADVLQRVGPVNLARRSR